MRFNRPKRITPQNVFGLMTDPDFPVLSYDISRDFDFMGKNSEERRDFESALCFKIIAARGYSVSSRYQPDVREAFCYNRAAKMAYYLLSSDPLFEFIDYACSNRALRLYEQLKGQKRILLLPDSTRRAAEEALEFTRHVLRKIKGEITSAVIVPDRHIWLVSEGQPMLKSA